MVLGIDEYLNEERKNKDTQFIAFKKYYQRIHKETGCKYRKWIEEIVKNWDFATQSSDNFSVVAGQVKRDPEKYATNYELYILGHSLDITDKDILRDLILNDNVKTTIYYYDKDTYGQQIANLVNVIGQKELIRKTGGFRKSITFKKQEEFKIRDIE